MRPLLTVTSNTYQFVLTLYEGKNHPKHVVFHYSAGIFGEKLSFEKKLFFNLVEETIFETTRTCSRTVMHNIIHSSSPVQPLSTVPKCSAIKMLLFQKRH